jgi:hypothetical protein
MDAAEKRYRDALVLAKRRGHRWSRPAALEDMEDVVAACAPAKGLPGAEDLLATYKRLLKATPQRDDGGEDSEDEDEADRRGRPAAGRRRAGKPPMRLRC